MYDRILLPTDGSPGMASALKHCFHLATQNDATVHVLFVIDIRAYIMLPEETQSRVHQLLSQEGDNAVSVVHERGEDAGISMESAVTEGVPHEIILQYADDNDLDLIVMGTHGRTGEKKRILGSVAEEVIRSAEIPVLTVRMEREELEELEGEVSEEQRRYIA